MILDLTTLNFTNPKKCHDIVSVPQEDEGSMDAKQSRKEEMFRQPISLSIVHDLPIFMFAIDDQLTQVA